MFALILTLCILLFLYQARLTVRAVSTYWHVRESKDSVKRHFHREQALTCINVFGGTTAILVLFFVYNF